MKLYVYSISLIFLLITCKKYTPTFVDEKSDEIIKYKINLVGNKITSYLKYSDNNFIGKTTFSFSDSVIEKITSNGIGKITEKVIYYIGDNSYAKSAIDSSYAYFGITVTKMQYEYKKNYLVKTIVKRTLLRGDPDTASYTLINRIKRGNIVSIKTVSPIKNFCCTDYYGFNSKINLIDINNFTNEITGKCNSNLINHISLYSDCLLSYKNHITPSNDFSYELNDNGYVVKMIFTYTPQYDLSSQVVKRNINTTIFEYNVR